MNKYIPITVTINGDLINAEQIAITNSVDVAEVSRTSNCAFFPIDQPTSADHRRLIKIFVIEIVLSHFHILMNTNGIENEQDIPHSKLICSSSKVDRIQRIRFTYRGANKIKRKVIQKIIRYWNGYNFDEFRFRYQRSHIKKNYIIYRFIRDIWTNTMNKRQRDIVAINFFVIFFLCNVIISRIKLTEIISVLSSWEIR